MYANSLCPAVLGSSRGDPDDSAGDWQLGRIIHQRQQHEDLIADGVTACRRNEDATAAEVRHERGVKRGFGIDIERENAGALRSGFCFTHL